MYAEYMWDRMDVGNNVRITGSKYQNMSHVYKPIERFILICIF